MEFGKKVYDSQDEFPYCFKIERGQPNVNCLYDKRDIARDAHYLRAFDHLVYW